MDKRRILRHQANLKNIYYLLFSYSIIHLLLFGIVVLDWFFVAEAILQVRFGAYKQNIFYGYDFIDIFELIIICFTEF